MTPSCACSLSGRCNTHTRCGIRCFSVLLLFAPPNAPPVPADARPTTLLALLLCRWRSQMLTPPHSLHWLLSLVSSQMLARPQFLQRAPRLTRLDRAAFCLGHPTHCLSSPYARGMRPGRWPAKYRGQRPDMPLPTHIGLNAMQCALLSHTCRRTRRETYFVLFELEQIQDSQSNCAAVLDSVLPWAWVFLNMAGSLFAVLLHVCVSPTH